MPFLRVTGRAVVNLHSANTEGAVGNYMGLSKMFIVRRAKEGYDISEDVVISGNMLKHWHAIHMVEILKASGYNELCPYCSRHVMYRSPIKTLNDEFDFVKMCAIDDAHGFLQPDTQIRRESIVKFSFLLPIEEIRAEYEAVTHNRVVVEESGKIPAEEAAMMVFKREHASGIYGFACSADLAYIGKSLSDPENRGKVLSIDDRRTRAKAVILALANLLSGHFGAASSRAMPAMRLTEVICAISKQPLPNLVHGFYYDYADESARILEATLKSGLVKDIKVFAAGDKLTTSLKTETLAKIVELCPSPIDAVTKATKVIEEWIE